MEESVVKMYSPLALAYIGDSIYDLMVKEHFVMQSNMQPEKYHKKVTSIVSANAQSAFVDYYMERLNETELSVYRRGRNSSPHTKAKNASLENYLKATGFEAVLGYLYLSEQTVRLNDIVAESIEFVTTRDNM
ncbi:ribonuclease-3 family protein [Lachnospiraceae bacterium NE2001]|nr:ribonuclease-3 family protein [Lachnospiraceae bacterium NE2001]